MTRFALAAAFLCLSVGSTVGQGGGLRVTTNTNTNVTITPEQARRQAIEYSKRSTIVPDRDALPVDEKRAKDLAAKYGRWHFWDGEEENRPEDAKMCDKYPSCDIPGDEFEDDAWQGDAVFVNHILNDADELVSRAMEAIFEEYGHPKPKTAEGLAARMKMFHWDKIDLATAEEPPEEFRGKRLRGNGGWTTKRSFDGLVRRLLHAMMTTSTFTVVVAGHSAAAGHGNKFRQSYSMQFHKVMAPVFARLGVKLITRNISQGGLGTLQNSLASGSIYGNEVDLILWDAGMTEKGMRAHIELFFRQALIGGKRAPVIWSAGGTFDILKTLHNEADVDVGEFGLGLDGIPDTTSDKQAQTLPWATQYLNCPTANQDVCKAHNDYCAKCWVDREDGITPEAKQLEHPGGQVGWHPGWRQHQLTGRVIAFSVLEALQQAVQQYSDGTMGGPPLADEYWHVDDYYKNIQEKVKNLDKSIGFCYDLKGDLPDRVCNTPLKGYSHYTPRANFAETAIVNIVKPAADGYVPKNEKKPLYEGMDAHDDCVDIPEGEVDVLAIVSGRRRKLQEELPFTTKQAATNLPPKSMKLPTSTVAQSSAEQQNHRSLGNIKPGRGWQIAGEPEGNCDGTYDAVCSRWTNDPCVLNGHHDARAVLAGNALSGWLVMNVPVKEGLIMIKVHSWTGNEENTITTDWTTENNERRMMLGAVDEEDDYDDSNDQRRLGQKDPAEALPDNFKFEFAIDGKITSLNKEEYMEKKKMAQRVVEIITLLDDPKFTDKEKDVEVAIRLQDCGRECTIGLSHIYYA